MIILFTGDGKGKTSAALGIALRASGYKMKTLMIQFMKKQDGSGEHRVPSPLNEFIDIHAFGGGFLFKGDDKSEHIKLAQKAWLFMEESLSKKVYQILILDELTVALKYGLINIDMVMDFLKNPPYEIHIIITGRDAPLKLLSIADIATEMKKISHIYDKGGPPVEGIDF
ncbi:MAG: cob(I)yrinic acid a,c-diamide adenosyltransferase [Syntrophorhabdaceae bacterium]|nr:cob(I)yrinic acid a,c-diamide adenosyltransferase [Syntrophorhabdaceae bacterium]